LGDTTTRIYANDAARKRRRHSKDPRCDETPVSAAQKNSLIRMPMNEPSSDANTEKRK